MLVVDDDPTSREVVTQYLRADGHRVVTANNGGEAMQHIAGDRFDVMITDHGMPGMNGFQLADAVQRTGAAGAHRLVLLTGFALAPEQQPKSIECMLRKPLVPDELRVAAATLGRTKTMKKSFVQKCRSGFSYVEILVACAIFGISAGAGINGLLRTNINAALSRLQTGASTVAEARIDLILSDGPFNPQRSQIPPELVPGVQTIGTSAQAPTIPIYTDPATGVVSVLGWMTSDVEDTATTYNGQNMNLYRATVTGFLSLLGGKISQRGQREHCAHLRYMKRNRIYTANAP